MVGWSGWRKEISVPYIKMCFSFQFPKAVRGNNPKVWWGSGQVGADPQGSIGASKWAGERKDLGSLQAVCVAVGKVLSESWEPELCTWALLCVLAMSNLK